MGFYREGRGMDKIENPAAKLPGYWEGAAKEEWRPVNAASRPSSIRN